MMACAKNRILDEVKTAEGKERVEWNEETGRDKRIRVDMDMSATGARADGRADEHSSSSSSAPAAAKHVEGRANQPSGSSSSSPGAGPSVAIDGASVPEPHEKTRETQNCV